MFQVSVLSRHVDQWALVRTPVYLLEVSNMWGFLLAGILGEGRLELKRYPFRLHILEGFG